MDTTRREFLQAFGAFLAMLGLGRVADLEPAPEPELPKPKGYVQMYSTPTVDGPWVRTLQHWTNESYDAGLTFYREYDRLVLARPVTYRIVGVDHDRKTITCA